MHALKTGMRTDRRYTIALCRGGLMVDETKALLRHWIADESLDRFEERVRNQDLLGRATARRIKDIVRGVFAPRFLRPTDRQARYLTRMIGRDFALRTLTEILFVWAARVDDLLYDFSAERFWPLCRSSRTLIQSSDVLAFFQEALDDGRIPRRWSSRVTSDMAARLLRTLREAGFIRQRGRGSRELVAYEMSDTGVVCLAHDLHESGLTDARMCEHADWRLFGMDREAVLERLDSIGPASGMLVQHAGSVVRISWRFESVEELIDGIA